MTPPKLLVFDLDGTLIDSSTDLCCSVNAMLQAFGKPPLPFPTITGYVGDGAAALVRRALDAGPSASTTHADGATVSFDSAYRYFLDYYREHKLDQTRPYDGVLDSLRLIRERGPETLMAVLTNKPVNPSRDICRGLGLSEFFFQNYGGDSLATKKPDPEGLLALIAEADALRHGRLVDSAPLQLSEVVMIGDSGVDVETARRCGVRSLGCTFGLAPQSLAINCPDITVDHASEWASALGFAT